ncbi:MAG: hypothetical protein ACTSYJ_08190, partial [Candidatus Thorarchaeota archaeon]
EVRCLELIESELIIEPRETSIRIGKKWYRTIPKGITVVLPTGEHVPLSKLVDHYVGPKMLSPQMKRRLAMLDKYHFINEDLVRLICLRCPYFEQCIDLLKEEDFVATFRGYLGMVDYTIKGIGIICEREERGVLHLNNNKYCQLTIKPWYYEFEKPAIFEIDSDIEIPFKRTNDVKTGG